MPVKDGNISIESWGIVEDGPYYIGETYTMAFTIKDSANLVGALDPDQCDPLVPKGENYYGAGALGYSDIGHGLTFRLDMEHDTFAKNVCMPTNPNNDIFADRTLEFTMPGSRGTTTMEASLATINSEQTSSPLQKTVQVSRGEPNVYISNTQIVGNQLEASASWSDPNGSIVSRLWTVTGPNGYRSTSSSSSPSFTLAEDGTYRVEIEVTDNDDFTKTAVERVQYGGGETNDSPTVQNINLSGQWPTYTVTASATDPENDPLVYSWVVTGPGGIVLDGEGKQKTFEAQNEGPHQIELEVTDVAGNKDAKVRGDVELAPAGNDECQSDSDCQSGYVCENGQCVPDNGGTGCQPGECPEGEVCIGGQCVPETGTGCQSDSECQDGYVCVNGQCVEDTSGDGFSDLAIPLIAGGSAVAIGGLIVTRMGGDDDE